MKMYLNSKYSKNVLCIILYYNLSYSSILKVSMIYVFWITTEKTKVAWEEIVTLHIINIKCHQYLTQLVTNKHVCGA